MAGGQRQVHQRKRPSQGGQRPRRPCGYENLSRYRSPTTAELVRVEQAIKSGGVEPRILREFRDAVDYVRKTAWAVQEWQERQLQKHDPQTVLPLLTAERIRRGTELSKAITADLAAYQVTRETIGIDEFFRAVESLHHRVADLFKDREA
jgi:hypothetical protein